MTPLVFEQRYAALWDELDSLLNESTGTGRRKEKPSPTGPDRARLAHLYRRCCEHLAIARSRAYPTHLCERLDDLTRRAHQLIYHRSEWGMHAMRRLISVTFPQQVRAHAGPLWVAFAVFAGPLLVMGLLTYAHPSLILSVLDAQSAANFGEMYGQHDRPIGRTAETDWQMFGHYILNNISIAFQCFASGLILGLGSLFYLSFNGAVIGTVAGYLTARGMSENFYSFVVTHSAFELTAIVLSGAAGLRLGQAILAPGRRRRVQALGEAARGTIVIIYGATALLLIAAAVEAFWSSARWVPHQVKYVVGAFSWIVVIAFLCWPGRARASVENS